MQLTKSLAVTLTALVAGTLALAVSAVPAAYADTPSGFALTFQAPDTRQWTIDPGSAPVLTPSALAQNSSPAIAALSTGGYEMAFAASDGRLWQVDPGGFGRRASTAGGILPPRVASRTSPAIAANAKGDWKIAYQDVSNHLYTFDSTRKLVDTGSIMRPGSSPAITALSTGGFEIAFVASDNFLWEVGSDGNGRRSANGLGVEPDTSPAIAAAPGGNFQITFQAHGLRTLWTVTPDHIGHDTGAAMAPGTSPAITALIPVAAPPTGGSPPPTGGNPPPGPEQRTVFLTRQPVAQGFIPYLAKFPELGSVQPGRLQRIRVPQSGFVDTTVLFVKIGHSTAECGNPNAVVAVVEGQTTTAAQLSAIYGQAQPTFTTLNPVFFVACINSPTLLNIAPIEITIQFD